MTKDEPRIYIKPYASFLEKTYRKNVLNNPNFPNNPPNNREWILPENWLSEITDIVRTQFVVKYLDGIEFLANKIHDVANEHSEECRIEFEAKEQGYYAAHVDVRLQFEIPKMPWGTEKTVGTVEIQITTQIKDVIRTLLHKQYESARLQTQTSDERWKWDYKSDLFTLNYLGHMLHYVEGMIMKLRDMNEE